MQYGYLELKLAWQFFEKAPQALSDTEQTRLREIAAKQSAIEQRILSSAEAASVIVPVATQAKRLAEIRQRYASEDELLRDLERIDLEKSGLEDAIERDLRIEAVLEKVASEAAPVSAVDAEIYYHLHPQAFDRPEARRLRHILITSNNANEKARAQTQLESLRLTLKTTEHFATAALRHSQCPTALKGGELGIVKRDQLYPELEAAAFALREGEISAVQESPIGLHLLRCDEILPSGLLPFAAVQEKIIKHLSDKRRGLAQRRWIKNCVAG